MNSNSYSVGIQSLSVPQSLNTFSVMSNIFQGIIVRHGGTTEQIIVHRAQSDNNHDGIMDLAQHSDHSN